MHFGLRPSSLVSILLVLGCDDRDANISTPATRVTQNPVSTSTINPATTASTQPAAVLIIDGQSVEFAPARLRLAGADDGPIEAWLYSDDPTQDTSQSFCLNIALDMSELARSGKTEWRLSAPEGEEEDTPDGIVLQAGNEQLQPLDVSVTVEGQGSPLVVRISGEFRRLDAIGNATTRPHIVEVSGTLTAAVSRD